MFGARFIVSFLVIVLIEIYFLQAVKIFSQDFSPNRRNFFIYFTYALGIVNLVLGMIAIFYPPPNWNDALRMVFSISLILFVCKALSCSFLLIDDIIRVGKMIYLSLISRAETIPALPAGISRSKFISQVAVGFASIAGLSFIYGMMRGAYKYRVHNVKVPSPNLPAAFDGYKIVQISDIHTGSFLNNSALIKAFDIVMQQNADVILFTGDL